MTPAEKITKKVRVWLAFYSSREYPPEVIARWVARSMCPHTNIVNANGMYKPIYNCKDCGADNY